MAACKGVVVNVYVAAQKLEDAVNSHKCECFRAHRFYLGERTRAAMQHRTAKVPLSICAFA